MVMQSLRTGASGGIGKFILFGLLGMAVAGLALSDVRGVMGSGGVGSNDVAKVGDETIAVQDFHRTVVRSLAQYRQYGVTPQQAYKLGLVDELLTGEIRKRFIIDEAKNLGIEIGRDQLKKRIAQVIAPQMQEGETPQEALDNILNTQGFTEAKFIEEVKREMAAEILTGAIKEGFASDTAAIAKDLFLFQNQSRDIEIILFPNEEIEIDQQPTEEQLKRLYQGVKHARYKIPETRSVKAALIDPTKIEVEVSTTQDELRDIYNSNKDAYLIDEQLVITQVLAEDEEKAKEIYDLVQAGKSLKDAGQEVLGEGVRYIEKVPFETYAMLPVMRDALSEREIDVVKPPVSSPLGVHIMKLDAIMPPAIQPFEAVHEQIKNELIIEKRAEQIYEIITDVEERLNNGADFKAVKKDVPLEIIDLEKIDRLGENWTSEKINANDKQAAIEAIFAIENDQKLSILEELPSGTFAMFELTSKTPESFQPFETVKKKLENQFIKDQQAVDNKLKLNKFLAEIGTGGSTLQTLAKSNKKEITKIENITIGGPIATPLNEEAKPIIFKTSINKHILLDLGAQYAIARVTSFKLPDIGAAPKEQLKAIEDTLKREAEEEALLMYVRYLGENREAQINKRLLEQVYGGTDEQ